MPRKATRLRKKTAAPGIVPAMKKHGVWALALATSVAGACKKSGGDGAEGGAAREKAAEAASPAAGKARGDAASGLWALAPADSMSGIVIADGVPARWFAAGKAMWDLAGQLPSARPLLDKARTAVLAELPFDPFDAAAYAKHGIDLSKGAAIFFEPSGDEPALTVLPVGDRKAFRELVHATVEQVGGREVDLMGTKGVRCLEDKGRYLCAKDVALIDRALAAHDSPLAKRFAALPPERRGDLEVYVDRLTMEGGSLDADEPRDVLATARIDATGLVARVHVGGAFVAETKGALTPAPVPAAFNGLASGAGMVLRGHVDLAPLLAQANTPATIPLPGADLRTDLIDQLGGDFQVAFAGITSATVAATVKDGARVTKMLGVLCGLAQLQGGSSPIPVTGITWDKESCTAEVGGPEITMALGKTIKLRAAVEKGMLVIGAGDRKAGGDALAEAGSPETLAILKGPGSVAYWLRGLDVLAAMPPAAAPAMAMIPPDAKAGLELASWLGAHVYEIATGVDVLADGVDVTFRVTTFGGDPPAAQAAFAAALAKRAAGDQAGYQAALGQLVQNNGDALAGRQAALQREGGGSAFTVGILAAIAIPAFVKYTERAREGQQRYEEKMRELEAELGKDGAPAQVPPEPVAPPTPPTP